MYERFGGDNLRWARAFLLRGFPMTEWTDSCHVILCFDWYSPASGILSQGKTKPESHGRIGAEDESGDISQLALMGQAHKCFSKSPLSHRTSLWTRMFRKTPFSFFSLNNLNTIHGMELQFYLLTTMMSTFIFLMIANKNIIAHNFYQTF